MDVGSLPSHRVEKVKRRRRLTHGHDFDAGTVRAEAANDPAAAQLHKRVGTTNGATDDGLVENFRWSGVIAGPVAGGGNQSFGFAGDASAVPLGDGDETLVPEAAESSNAVRNAEGNVAGGQ